MRQFVGGLFALLMLAGAGCATLSEKAARVQMHRQQSTAIASCTRLAPVAVRESRFKPAAVDFLSVKVREAAADAGGDSVLVLGAEEALTEVVVHGVAYKCF